MSTNSAPVFERDPTDVIRRFCESFVEQIQAVRLVHTRISNDGEIDLARINYLMKEVHRLGGSAHCMGFRLVGSELLQLENDIETLITTPQTEHPEQLAKVDQKLESIERFAKYVRPENARPPSVQLSSPSGDAISTLSPTVAKLLSEQRILFADDDALVRNLIGDMLHNLGVGAVRTAESGAAVLQLASSFKPTILMTDWNMQPINGLELLTMIRNGESSLATDTAVIFLTSQSNVSRVRSALREGVDHFLVKPFTQEVIVRAIETIANRKTRAA